VPHKANMTTLLLLYFITLFDTTSSLILVPCPCWDSFSLPWEQEVLNPVWQRLEEISLKITRHVESYTHTHTHTHIYTCI